MRLPSRRSLLVAAEKWLRWPQTQTGSVSFQLRKLSKKAHSLVTEGIELHQELLERLANVPTPAGPTPRELEAQRQGETMVIPIKSIRRTAGQS